MARVVDMLRGMVKKLDSDKVVKVATCRCLAVLIKKYKVNRD